MQDKIVKVKVSAGARQENVQETLLGDFKIHVREKAEKGKANERVLELIADYFNVSKSSVSLVSGVTYKEKIIKIKF